jgi:hypothetical protein
MKKYFLFIAAILILGSGCKKSFLNVDETNPNTASSAPGTLILPAALNFTAAIMNDPKNWDFVYLWYGIWSITGGYTINADLTQYNIRTTSYQANWDAFYLAAKSFDDIQQASTTPQQQITFGIAKIMKAYIFQNLVDLYGDVPYSQAFLGSSNLKPKYDNQQTIYRDLIVQIDAGITALKTAPADAIVPNATQDIMYAGKTSLWIRFANTLKLRILLHQSGMADANTYAKPLAAAITGGFIVADSGAMVNPPYQLTALKTNPSWAAFYNADATFSHVDGGFNYYAANLDMLDFCWNNANFADLRVYALYTPYANTSGLYTGNYFGVGNQLAPAACSGIGTGNMKSYAQSSIILSDFESYFLQAEAAQRGWIGTTADASTYYYAAVKANYKWLGLTSNTWSLYLNIPATVSPDDYTTWVIKNAGDPNYDYSAATDKIKLLMTQKWLALSGNTAVEIWTDYRRTGFPNFIHWSTDAAKKNPTPPIRLLYPQREIQTNGDNVPAIGRNTADLFAAKIFWQNR